MTSEGTANMLRELIEARTVRLEDLKQRKILVDKAIAEIEQAQIEDSARLKEIEDNDKRNQ